MPNNNKLFLRELSSPYGDISRKRTLSFKDLDSNFIFLKGELIDSITVENGNFILKKLSGEDINIPISEITQSDDELLKSISGATEELRLGITENRLWDNGTEGINSIRIKNDSGTDATGDYSHAEGANTTASGSASHAEGSNTRARGTASHAGGASSQANGDFSFAHTKGTSKADGESSVVLGGALHVVENGGENSGVLLGNTNRILGLDYQKLISDTENEINRLKDKRDEENANYEQLQNDLSEEIEKKQSEIDILNDEIKDIEEEITTIQNRINVINRYPVDDTNVNILTKKIQDLSAKKQEKLQAISSLTYEIGALQFEIESSTDIESEAQQNYDEERERLEKLLDEYNKSLYEFDGYLPKQSTIVGGDSNIINSASESIINGGSGNTISSKIKNSGIFGGSKNELGGGTYIVLITRLLEELSQRAEEKAKYDDETEKLISHLQSDIADKQKQLQSEKQQQPQDLGLIATLEADIKELKEEKKVLEEGLSRNNEGYVEYVNETNAKIESYRQSGGLYVGDEEEGPSTVITPIDGASIIAGSGNKIIHLSDNSSIVGGKSNLIDNAAGSVILGGEGITATTNNTVYTPNLNIDIQPANDNSLTQVLVRDGDGNVKYKDVSSFTDLSVVSGVYDVRTGIVTFINNDGDSFEISGFTSGMTDSYTTDAYLEDKTIYFNNNIKGDDIYSVDISPILDDVIAAVGLNDNRGICSIKSYNEYTSKVQEYYDSKKAYDEYESNIQILTDEITNLESIKTSLQYELSARQDELSTKQNELVSIRPGSALFEANYYSIIHENQTIIDSVNEIKSLMMSWDYGKTETEFFAEDTLKGLITLITFSLETWSDLNSSLAINTTVNYQRKEEIINSLTIIKNSLDNIQTISDTMAYTDTEEVFLQNKTDIINSADSAIQSSNELENDVTLSRDYYEQTNNDLQNDIEQLQNGIQSNKADIESLLADIEQKQLQKESYVDSIQEIIDSGALEFAPYVPANEANFNCWRNELLDDKIDTKTDLSLFNSYTSSTETVITGITSAVGYDDRGSCSEEQYAKYKSEVHVYYTSKEAYDEYESNIKTLTDEITQLNSDIDILKSDLEFKFTDVIYTQITGGSVEELQIIIDQKEADLNSKQAELEQKEVERERDIKRQEEINNSGALEFAPYVPANEANFNCWSERQIIDSVGYDNRGNCSGDRYKKYLSEYNNALEFFNTQIPSSPPSFKEEANLSDTITYNNLSTERQKIIDYWVEFTTYTNNLISSYELEIAKYQTILDTLNAIAEPTQSEQDEIDGLVILISLLEDKKSNIEEEYDHEERTYNLLIDWFDHNLSYLESTDEYNFIQEYTPINEVNFNCWNDSEDYNDLNTQITGITSAVGYDDRGSCSEEQYASYKSEVQKYYDSKEVYDQYESNIKTLTDEITELNSDIDTLKTEINTLERTILLGKLDGIDQTDNQNLKNQKEADLDTKQGELRSKQVKKEKYIDDRQQIIDSGALEFAPYVPANEANFNCWSEQQIIDSVGYDDRGTCDAMSYDMYQRLVQQLKAEQSQYNENIREFNDAKEIRTVEHEKYKKERADITNNIYFYQNVLDQINKTIQIENRDATPEELDKIAILELLINELQTELNTLDVSENDAVEAYEEYIAAYNEWIINFENNIKPDIDRYLPENEVNYSCWRNELFYENAQSQRDEIISNVGYDDRGRCSKERFDEYIEASDYYNSKKEEYDEYESNIKTLTDEITQLNSDIDTLITEINTLERTIILGRLDGIDQTDNKNLKNQKEADLDTKQAELRQKQEDRERDIERQQLINNSGALAFARYAPVNEVNYNCWENNELNKFTHHVYDSLGVGSRGLCDMNTYILYQDLVKGLELHQSEYNKIIIDRNEATEVRTVENQNFKKEYDVITDNIAFYQNVLDQINQTIQNEDRDATPEELTKIAILEQLIEKFTKDREELEKVELERKEAYEARKSAYDEQIAHFENNIKPDIDRYLPSNEVNYNCWRNEFFFNELDTKVQTIKNEVDYQIYDIESILIDSDLPGTFNYYPNIYDEFTENPKFIIDEFDDLDNIINLDGGDLRSWGKLICIGSSPESPGVLWDNLTQSIRCIETLKSDITNTETELSNDFDSLKNNYEQQLQILQGLQIDDPEISTDALELKISNMVEKRNEEFDLFSYMVQKLNHVLNIYEQVYQISKNFCNEGEA